MGQVVDTSDEALVVFGEGGGVDAMLSGQPAEGGRFVPSVDLSDFLFDNLEAHERSSLATGDSNAKNTITARSSISSAVDNLFTSLASALSDSNQKDFCLSERVGLLAAVLAKGLGARLGIKYYAESEFAKRLHQEFLAWENAGLFAANPKFTIWKDESGLLHLRPLARELPKHVQDRSLPVLKEKGRVVRSKTFAE